VNSTFTTRLLVALEEVLGWRGDPGRRAVRAEDLAKTAPPDRSVSWKKIRKGAIRGEHFDADTLAGLVADGAIFEPGTGYEKTASKLLMCWGGVVSLDTGSVTATFAKPFVNPPRIIPSASASSFARITNWHDLTETGVQFDVRNLAGDRVADHAIHYLAIGRWA
jgi:hypothetical protein